MPDETHSQFEAALTEAERYMAARDFTAANEAFARAHVIGHDITRLHVRAHLAMLRCAVRQRKPGAALAQLPLIAFAQFFTRPLFGPKGLRTRRGATRARS